MNYGLGYMGSKSKICAWLFGYFPKVDNLYDLFCGGCSVTHYSMAHHFFKTHTINDLQGCLPLLFLRAVNGEFKDERRWISREDFFALMDSDPYVRTCWSFGNDGKSYLYSRTIEPYKKACHYAVVLDEWEQLYALCPDVADTAHDALKEITDRKKRRLAFGLSIVKRLKEIGDWDLVQANPLYKSCHWRCGRLDGKNNGLERLERLQSLQSLESLERLQRLQSLERLQRLQRLQSIQGTIKMYSGDYQDVPVRENSLCYCDIPYKNTKGYHACGEFDHERFYEWCSRQTELVMVSEYNMPSDRFVMIAEKESRSTMSSTNNACKSYERLFVPKHQIELYHRLMDDNKETL